MLFMTAPTTIRPQPPVYTAPTPQAVEKTSIAPSATKGRRNSFKPRPSSPGLGTGYAEMWRGKGMIRDEAVAELEEDSDAGI